MKKLLFLIAVMLIAQASFSQIFSWGIKGGVNSTKITFDDFNVGDPTISIDYDYLAEHPEAVEFDDENNVTYIDPQAFTVSGMGVEFSPSSYEMGYHFGGFARIKLLGLFIQPELLFSHAEASINVMEPDLNSVKESTATINYNKFDVPVMIGIKLGPARLNMGPVATFNLSPNVEGAKGEVNDVLNDFTEVTNLATFGGQLGVGLDILKKVTLDVRYEFPLSKLGDDVTIGENTFSTDQRQSQFIGSIGWMF
ncbi:MAG: porin family protein [Salinivirgaceae bacterium]|jgi:hypothetical protein|nr:porin family protein [Salinivirgaceae bacterium]